jgi:exo-beta-1,3-glucanase (GH17 family)
MQEISAIAAKGFSAVRIYATDCNQLENVGAACKQYGLKMIIGIFIESSGICQDTYNQLNEIVSYFNGNYENVELVAIGNEALFNGYCSGAELAAFISHCASTLKGAGYSGPITTTDTVAALQANAGALCPVIDVVAANMYSFFNGNVSPGDSGTFIAGQIQMLQKSCPNKEVYNLECGWPSQGPSYMNAVPSAENQAAFIKSVMEADSCGHTVFFTAENDMWKNDGSPSVEPYFGCLSQFE